MGSPRSQGEIWGHQYAYLQKSEIEKMVQKMLEVGIIRHSQSAYSSLVVMVRKKDEGWHMCPYYRELKKCIVKDKYLIPVIEDLLDELHGSLRAPYFSSGWPFWIPKNYHKVNQDFFWEGLKVDVQKFVAGCLMCQCNKGETVRSPRLLQPLSIPSERWEEVSMDFITGLPKSDGKSVIMVVVDRLTNMDNLQAASSSSWNLDNWYCLPPSCNGIDLQRETLIPNKGVQPVRRSLVHFELQRSLFSRAALDEKQQGAENAQETTEQPSLSTEKPGQNNGAWKEETYPLGEFEYEKIEGWNSFLVKLKMLIALPWERVKKGSVLNMKLRGQISDQLQDRFSSRLSLPKICENFIKAAHDPRIAGIYLQIEPLDCGWGKIDEIRRHILDYRKSGKFVVCYIPVCGEKEYYLACACGELYVPPGAYITLYGLKVQASFLGGVFEKIGVQPQIQRIGKYKSTGDLLSRKNMSKENCEMLTAILDDIYGNWVEKISSAQGKTREDIENLLNEGIYKVERLKEEGLINDIKYDDEVTKLLKERLGQKQEGHLQLVDYKNYSRVRKWSLGLSGGRDQIAVIRSSGSISRVRGRFSSSRSGIVSEQFIEKIRQVRASKKYKAVILRIDSPGGDALASDLMWREIRLLAASKPVIASMVDVAASGGYYMAMAAGVILSENLTLTGSIGVVTVNWFIKFEPVRFQFGSGPTLGWFRFLKHCFKHTKTLLENEPRRRFHSSPQSQEGFRSQESSAKGFRL
ncbi:hypothetical protein KI387_028979 [Taxus chinensis]|uniref:Uncharacterized protein n=1 Tax=Taxus chinensis TaxID=29808 RepID=A0AA38FD24_TAXCH|nr:hypothetical protein KI387_028979 [Taxus chinensis]